MHPISMRILVIVIAIEVDFMVKRGIGALRASKIGFTDFVEPLLDSWRRERDSNPRYVINVHTLSRRAPSAARSSLLSDWLSIANTIQQLNQIAFKVIKSLR